MILKYIILITVLIAFSRSSIWSEIMAIQFYYLWFGFISLLAAFSLKHEKELNRKMLIFIIVAVLSILLNKIDSIFLPWERLFSFIIMMVSIGPFIENTFAAKYKVKLFKTTNIFVIVITVVSFVGYLLNLPSFKGYSGFNGLTSQSMVLGPLAGLSSLIALNLYFNSKNYKQRISILVVILISLLTCLIAASRGAFLSLLISLVAYIYISFRHSFGKILKLGFFITFILIATSSFWLSYAEVLVNKHQNRLETNNIFSGRDVMIIDRVKDFKESPIFGVGFNSMKNVFNSKISFSGNMEPGSSWFFLLSTLGLLGLIIFLLLMVYPIYTISRKKKLLDNSNSLIASMLVYFVFHLVIEGYLFGSGGFLFFYLWLSISVAQKKVLMYV